MRHLSQPTGVVAQGAYPVRDNVIIIDIVAP